MNITASTGGGTYAAISWCPAGIRITCLSRPSFFKRQAVFSNARGWMSKAYTRPDGPTPRARKSVSRPLPAVASTAVLPSPSAGAIKARAQ
ncbi:hypothetical protein A6M21_03645 [Desulfotomaculum copahuensis]|uniref:Uncharacterized protein n=1 Tax=Desulfotomaculum copahuensis TaxID=1838280 RepID=A0A1B7LIW8_9FIRM|nr:hypothetical protein A6M21_03645 [Desulfotomaculum copahuensis]